MAINPNWANPILEKLAAGESIDQTISQNVAAQWLITALARRNLNFKVYNLGAGVKRITTDADKCPCCKKPL